MRCFFFIIMSSLFLCYATLSADTPDSTQSIKHIERQLSDMQRQLNQLLLEKKKQEQDDTLKKLLQEANQLTTVEKKTDEGIGKKFQSGTRQQSALNPNISVGGDFFIGVNSSKATYGHEPGEFSYGTNRMQLREMEVTMQASLDPFTRGKSHISFSEGEVAVEEAYMEWLNLPANMNMRIGLFNAEFGILNRYHNHALPQFDRPRVLVNMFGIEPLGGYGIAGNFLLPTLLFADASSLDISVLRCANEFSFTTDGTYNLVYVGQFKNYYDLNRDTFFEWSLSGAAGNNDPGEKYRSYLGDAAFTLKWAPIGRAKYRTIEWQNEFIDSYRDTPAGFIKSKGFYSSLQNKLNARYWISGRIGYTEFPFDHSQHEWDVTGCIDFWQSEFVFYRLQYQYNMRAITNNPYQSGPYPDHDHSLVLQISWAMGPHKHEKY
ncbi:hypothetical protein JW960_01360 [candidate division KSB1 bacterium]|nr:hypothetical protein [candidate division KSB1 bacterium]